MSKVLSTFEINEIKIAIAVLYRKDISYSLRLDKLWDLYNILRMEELEKETIHEEDKPSSFKALIGLPKWITILDNHIVSKRPLELKKAILKRLIELEAYLEIIELGLDKIK